MRQAAQFICLSVCSLGPYSSGRCSLLEEVPCPSPHHFSLLSHLNSLSCIISISFLMKELWDQSRISHLPELKLSYDRFLFPSLSSLSGSHLAPTLVLPTRVPQRGFQFGKTAARELVPMDKVRAGQRDQCLSGVSSSPLNRTPSSVVQ